MHVLVSCCCWQIKCLKHIGVLSHGVCGFIPVVCKWWSCKECFVLCCPCRQCRWCLKLLLHLKLDGLLWKVAWAVWESFRCWHWHLVFWSCIDLLSTGQWSWLVGGEVCWVDILYKEMVLQAMCGIEMDENIHCSLQMVLQWDEKYSNVVGMNVFICGDCMWMFLLHGNLLRWLLFLLGI